MGREKMRFLSKIFKENNVQIKIIITPKEEEKEKVNKKIKRDDLFFKRDNKKEHENPWWRY